jgi:tetratricopeptide (TPR) repeat protein
LDDFKQAIIKGNFAKAKHLSINMDLDTLKEELYLLAYDSETIAPYGFINYLLLDKESSELHYLASYLLGMGLNHLEGAYQTAFFHAKRAVELAPQDNSSYKEYLLFFYEIPAKLLRKDEATKIANEILKIDPTSKPALSVVNGS